MFAKKRTGNIRQDKRRLHSQAYNLHFTGMKKTTKSPGTAQKPNAGSRPVMVKQQNYRAEEVRADQYVDIFNGTEVFSHFTADIMKRKTPFNR